MTKKLNPEKMHMLSWLIVPIIGVWLAIGYLVGTVHHPTWDVLDPKITQPTQVQVQQPTKTAYEKIKWSGGGLITLWFDDAWLSQYSTAFPMMEDKNLKGSLAVPTKLLGQPSYMSWAQVEKMQSSGWEISSHTRTHNCNPDHLSAQQVEDELAGAKQDLLAHNITAENFVTPCGAGTPLIDEIAKKYYVSLRGSGVGYNPLPVQDPYTLNVQAVHSFTTPEYIKAWVEHAKTNNEWLIIMFHQVDDGTTDYATTPAKLNDMLNVIKESNVPVVLPTQALQVVLNQTASK